MYKNILSVDLFLQKYSQSNYSTEDLIRVMKDFEFATGIFNIIDGEKQEGVYMYRIEGNEPVDPIAMPVDYVE